MILETLITTLIGSAGSPLPVKKPFINPYVPKCVIDTIWHEARGEGLDGQLAVLNVIYNRVNYDTGVYGKTPCEVVTRPSQFAYFPVNPDIDGYYEFNQRIQVNWMKNTPVNVKAKESVGKSTYFISEKNLDTFPNWYYKKRVHVTIKNHTFLTNY